MSPHLSPDLRGRSMKEFCPKLVSRQVQLNRFTLGGKFNQLACSVTNLPLNIIQDWEGQLFNLLSQLTQFVSRIFYSKKRLAKTWESFVFKRSLRLYNLLSSTLVWVCAQWKRNPLKSAYCKHVSLQILLLKEYYLL